MGHQNYVLEARLLAARCGLVVHTESGVPHTNIRASWDVHDVNSREFFGHFKSGKRLLAAVQYLHDLRKTTRRKDALNRKAL